MSIEAYMMRTLMVENIVDILEACIHRSLLIDIVFVIDDVVTYIQKHALEVHWVQHITALVNETFNKINYSFVTNGMKIMNLIKARHRYFEDIYVMRQKN